MHLRNGKIITTTMATASTPGQPRNQLQTPARTPTCYATAPSPFSVTRPRMVFSPIVTTVQSSVSQLTSTHGHSAAVSIASLGPPAPTPVPQPGPTVTPTGTVSLQDISCYLKPFTGAANATDVADKWIKSFNLYARLKHMNDADKLCLFELMMADQAATWFSTLPMDVKTDFTGLQTTFKQRYAMSPIDKFRKSKEILHRTQAPSESVDDYFAWMQSAAEKVDLPESALKQAIIQGLRPNIRVFVLHSQANTLAELLQVARTSETAHGETASTPQQLDELTAKLDMWMSQQQATINKQDESINNLRQVFSSIKHTTADNASSNKHVTFTQSSVSPAYSPASSRAASPIDNDCHRRRTSGLSTTDRPTRPVSPARRPNGQWLPAETTHSRGVHQPSTWQQSQRGQPQRFHSTPANFYNQQSRNRSWSQNSSQMGKCSFCGKTHQPGRSNCPAANVSCYNCKKLGHLARMCYSTHMSQNVLFNH